MEELVNWLVEKWGEPHVAALFAAYRADDPKPIVRVGQTGGWDPGLDIVRLMFFNERGIAAPDFVRDGAVHSAETAFYDCARPVLQLAEAITANDSAMLESAIEEVEAHRLIPHAARMRIVLAQWTGDRTQLERARPVLERLGDRQFLRRLEAVDATLA